MPFTGDSFAHLFDWEKDPQRQEKIVNARLEAEFDGVDTGLSALAARATALEAIGYSTGSWNPAFTFATPGDLSISYAARGGSYTKIGNVVFYRWFFVTSSFTFGGSASGNALVTGYPFAVNSFGTAPVSFSGFNLPAGYTTAVLNIGEGGTQQSAFYINGDNVSVTTLTAADTPTGGTVNCRSSGIYFT
jgi:hypothetical protein